MATKAKRERTKRQKPGYLPGMEPPSIPEIDSAAEAYHDARRERKKLMEEEKNAKNNLIEKMVANGQTRYVTSSELVVNLLSKSNISCNKKQQAEINGEE